MCIVYLNNYLFLKGEIEEPKITSLRNPLQNLTPWPLYWILDFIMEFWVYIGLVDFS